MFGHLFVCLPIDTNGCSENRMDGPEGEMCETSGLVSCWQSAIHFQVTVAKTGVLEDGVTCAVL